MVTQIIVKKKVRKLKNPVFLEGMPGVGNVGRIAAGFLVEKLKAEKIAELYSSYFQHVTLIHSDGTAHVIKGEFYIVKANKKNGLKRDLVIYLGDQQSELPQGTYELVHEILNFIKKLGVKELITMGGLKMDVAVDDPIVYGVASDKSIIKKYSKYPINFNSASKVGSIVGAVGLLIGYAPLYGMKGISLLVESFGPPILPDHKGAKKLLELLQEVLSIKLDLSEIAKKAKEQDILKEKIMRAGAPAETVKREKKTDIGSSSLTYIG